MRILITGGTGFFGKSLFRYKNELNNPDTFLVSRRDKMPWSNLRATVIHGDVRNFKYPEGDFDYIYHGAAPSSSIEPIPDDVMVSTIIDGTERVLNFAKNTSAKLLFVSSGAVYHKASRKVGENTPCNPFTEYGRAKLEAEKMCLQSGVDCRIARCFSFIGEYLPLEAHFAIANFIKNCLENTPIVIKGDGTPFRSYMHAEDLVKWLWKIMTVGRKGSIYNVGSDRTISIYDLARTVKRIAGIYLPIQISLRSSFAGQITECYAPNIDKARKELGLNVLISLEEAIKRTLEYHRGNVT